jgi:hypothetical protein
MHSSMKSLKLKTQLGTKNNSMFVSMKVSLMVVKVVWFHNIYIYIYLVKVAKYLKSLIFRSL